MGPPDANKLPDDGTSGTSSGGGDATSGDASASGGGGGREPKITVLRLELPTALKDEAVARLVEFLRGSPGAIEKDMATDLKKHFDQKHGQTWHCIVGKRFGCSVAYDTQFLLFFQADQHYVLLFKSVE